MIRQGTQDEVEIFMTIIERSTKDLDDKGIMQWDSIYPDKLTVIGDIESKALYCYEEEKNIKGIITLSEEQDPEYATLNWRFNPKKILVVHRICIDPDYQGKGIGKALMKYAEDYGREKGYEALRLDAFIQNPISCGLYEKIGYQKVGIITLRKGQFYCYEKRIM